MEPTLKQTTLMLEKWHGRIWVGGAIGAIAPLKPTKVIFITHDFVQFGETAFTI